MRDLDNNPQIVMLRSMLQDFQRRIDELEKMKQTVLENINEIKRKHYDIDRLADERDFRGFRRGGVVPSAGTVR